MMEKSPFPSPLTLSLSKGCPFLFAARLKKVQCFDKLSTSGIFYD